MLVAGPAPGLPAVSAQPRSAGDAQRPSAPNDLDPRHARIGSIGLTAQERRDVQILDIGAPGGLDIGTGLTPSRGLR